jgi:hypothetical protein
VVRKNCADGYYRLESGLGAGLGIGFWGGLETPKLMRKKRKPLRRESSRLMGAFRRHTQIIAHEGLRRFWVSLASASDKFSSGQTHCSVAGSVLAG